MSNFIEHKMQKSPSKLLMLTLIVLTVTIGQVATDIFLPSFTNMAQYYNVGIHQVERTIVVFMIGFMLGTLIYGPLSDHYGRKKIILISLLVSATTSILCGFAPTIEFLWCIRFIQGFAISACTTLARAMVKDISSDEREMAKLASVIGVMYAITISIAPIFGGIIEQHFHHWQLTFFLLSGYLFILFLVIWRNLIETNVNLIKINWHQYFVNYSQILRNKGFLRYSAISSLALAGEMAYLTIAPNILQNVIGVSPQNFGFSVLVVSFALCFAGIMNNRLVKFCGIDKMLRLSAIIMVASTLIMLMFACFHVINTIVIVVPVFIFLIGAGGCFSNGSSGAISIFKTKAGSASSVYSFIQIVGGMLGSYSVTCLPHDSQIGLSIVESVLAGFVVLLVYFARPLEKNEK